MEWSDITSRFNHRFAGKILPGLADPRPPRTIASLRSERYRVPVIRNYMKTVQSRQAQEIEENQRGKGQEEGQEKGQVKAQEEDRKEA